MKIFKPIKRRHTKSISSLSGEEDLAQKLVVTVGLIVLLIFLSVGGLLFFAPSIGTFFGFFSKNRNDTGSENNIKPNPPILNEMPEATKEKEIDIKGYAGQNETIKLFVNGPEVASISSSDDGSFTFEKVKLNDGKNSLFAKSINTRNIESDKSKTYVINVDTKEPKLEITSLKDGDVIKNLDKRILVSGKLDEEAEVSINDNVAIVKPELTFDFLLGVNEGEVKIKIVATDKAGNKTEKELKVTYRKASY